MPIKYREVKPVVVSDKRMDQWISIDVQNEEIERLKNAEVGEVIFTTTTKQNSDIIDTLIHKSGIQYHIGVKGMKITYYKG